MKWKTTDNVVSQSETEISKMLLINQQSSINQLTEVLMQEHNFHIVFSPCAMYNKENIKMVLLNKLQITLILLFEVVPYCLLMSHAQTTFLTNLKADVGPSLLHWMRFGLQSMCIHSERIKLFLTFYSGITDWFTLFLCRGSFLNYVSSWRMFWMFVHPFCTATDDSGNFEEYL